MGDGKYGVKLKIPEILKCRETNTIAIKLNDKPIQGRPVVVVKKLLELLIDKDVIDKTIIEHIIVHGLDRGYWTDADLFKAAGKYFLFDMYKTKEERLKEVRE